LLYLAFILLVFLLIISIPIFLSVVLYRYLKKKKSGKWLKYLALIPAFLVGYLLYYSVFPDDDFYKTDFKEVTGLEFPADAKIISKTASFPDLFGDYTSVFMIKTNKDGYIKVLGHLEREGFHLVRDSRYSPDTQEQLAHSNLQIKAELNSERDQCKDFYVAFLSDSCTILIRRISW
jgi:hypothetical protein